MYKGEFKAVITGASGGIGISAVKKFLTEGYTVIAQYNSNGEPLENLRKDLSEEDNQRLYSVKADFTEEFGVQKFTEYLAKNFKRIDVLINNAGIDCYKLIKDTTDKDLADIFNVNFFSAYKLCRYVVPKMISGEGGKIINVSSIWGTVGGSMETAYSASKAALIGLTKSLAKEVGKSNITVNAIAPGVIDTKMNAIFNKEEMAEIIDKTPIGRIGTPEEVADLMLYLASEKANFITGQIITVDGGFTL